METIMIKMSDLENLKLARKKAIARGDDRFVFKGRTIIVSFAKYLIEYLENEIK